MNNFKVDETKNFKVIKKFKDCQIMNYNDGKDTLFYFYVFTISSNSFLNIYNYNYYKIKI